MKSSRIYIHANVFEVLGFSSTSQPWFSHLHTATHVVPDIVHGVNRDSTVNASVKARM